MSRRKAIVQPLPPPPLDWADAVDAALGPSSPEERRREALFMQAVCMAVMTPGDVLELPTLRRAQEHSRKFAGGKQPKGDLWQVMADVDATTGGRHSPLQVMRAVYQTRRLTNAKLVGTRLFYQAPPGRDRSVGLDAFRVKLAAVRRARPGSSKNR
jgi:hypothetical protein